MTHRIDRDPQLAPCGPAPHYAGALLASHSLEHLSRTSHELPCFPADAPLFKEDMHTVSLLPEELPCLADSNTTKNPQTAIPTHMWIIAGGVVALFLLVIGCRGGACKSRSAPFVPRRDPEANRIDNMLFYHLARRRERDRGVSDSSPLGSSSRVRGRMVYDSSSAPLDSEEKSEPYSHSDLESLLLANDASDPSIGRSELSSLGTPEQQEFDRNMLSLKRLAKRGPQKSLLLTGVVLKKLFPHCPKGCAVRMKKEDFLKLSEAYSAARAGEGYLNEFVPYRVCFEGSSSYLQYTTLGEILAKSSSLLPS